MKQAALWDHVGNPGRRKRGQAGGDSGDRRLGRFGTLGPQNILASCARTGPPGTASQPDRAVLGSFLGTPPYFPGPEVSQPPAPRAELLQAPGREVLFTPTLSYDSETCQGTTGIFPR